MRIGIWCDYGFTLEPSEGIGVFVDNLARGLVKADRNVTVTMVAHCGQEHKLDSIVSAGGGRIDVVSGPIKLAKPRRFLIRTLKRLRNAFAPYDSEQANNSKFVTTLDRWVHRLSEPAERSIVQHVAGCDVWLLPYVGLDRVFSKPTVVVIHDLVSYHFPEMLGSAELRSLKKVVDKISNRATIAACMSEFIRDNDLFGTLGLPATRVRVVKAAVPDDLGMDAKDSNASDLSTAIAEKVVATNDPYLFYPSAFRTYKNHACLIEAISILKARSAATGSVRNWRVVFTGSRQCPPLLQEKIDRLGVSDSVITLGKVSRPELVYLYRNAFATIVPSLYEQGSFPVMEALHCDCPVAASNIPSLMEQFHCMGESMLFFDPHDATSLADVIEQIAVDRQRVIDEQREGFAELRRTRWEDVAKQWLELFRQVTLLGSTIHDVRSESQQRAA